MVVIILKILNLIYYFIFRTYFFVFLFIVQYFIFAFCKQILAILLIPTINNWKSELIAQLFT